MDENLKIDLLKSVGNESAMRTVLLDCMERTQAEYCAFYAVRQREYVYILCESGELAPRVPEIHEKLRASYRMFTNGLASESQSVLKILYRREHAGVAYLLDCPRIESYFLVPLAFGSKVRGVLFFGSVRREAFSRGDIAAFRSLAEEGEEREPLIFRIGGERDIFDRLLAALPAGAALVSPDGNILASNRVFTETLMIRDEAPESVFRIASMSPFDLQGIWEEFSILQHDVRDRELKASVQPERSISVSWMRVQDLAEDVGSLVLLRDVTAAREQAEMREEMIAMVAHELRTPLTALKSSLAIVAESELHACVDAAGVSPSMAGGLEPQAGAGQRFLCNSLRTVERLERLVDGLIDSSAARIDERPMRIDHHDVKAFLGDATSLFIEPMRKKGIRFQVFVDHDAERLAFDRDRIEQVVQNLLANSIKHVPSGGAISITIVPCIGCPTSSFSRILLGHLGRLSFADLCVRDTGIGMPTDVARRMNESVGAAYRPVRGSKGLGLLVAQRLVRLHGGSLYVEEGVAGGSAVHLYLPADEETTRIVQQYRAADMRFEELMSRGLTPIVYCVENPEHVPWQRALANTRGGAAVNPPRSEPADGEMLVWPLGPAFAIAVSPRDRGEDVMPAELRSGRASARRDGMKMSELIAVALSTMIEREAAAVAVKGEEK